MATPATAPTLRPGRGQRFCKCDCGQICGTKFGYVPGHGPVEAEPRKPKRAGRRGIEDREKIKQLACEMYRAGASTRAIAKELGIGNSLAHRLVSEDRTSRTVRSVKPRKQRAPKPVAFAEPFHAPGVDVTRVDVKVTPTWLDQWFSQLPIANKVAIFNAQSEL